MVSLGSPLQITGAGIAAAGIPASSRGSRATVPVSPANYIYSQFKHVSGVPAPQGVQGVTVSKVKILDTLIDHFVKAKQNKKLDALIDKDMRPAEMSDRQLDYFIEKLHNEIESATAANLAIPYTPNPQVAAGTLFNISA